MQGAPSPSPLSPSERGGEWGRMKRRLARGGWATHPGRPAVPRRRRAAAGPAWLRLPASGRSVARRSQPRPSQSAHSGRGPRTLPAGEGRAGRGRGAQVLAQGRGSPDSQAEEASWAASLLAKYRQLVPVRAGSPRPAAPSPGLFLQQTLRGHGGNGAPRAGGGKRVPNPAPCGAAGERKGMGHCLREACND